MTGVLPVFCGRSGVEALADNALEAELGGRLFLPTVVFGVLPEPDTRGVGNPVFLSNLLELAAFTGVSTAFIGDLTVVAVATDTFDTLLVGFALGAAAGFEEVEGVRFALAGDEIAVAVAEGFRGVEVGVVVGLRRGDDVSFLDAAGLEGVLAGDDGLGAGFFAKGDCMLVLAFALIGASDFCGDTASVDSF